jgi:hypothetical protein
MQGENCDDIQNICPVSYMWTNAHEDQGFNYFLKGTWDYM